MNYHNKSKKELIVELLKVRQELFSNKETPKIENKDVGQLEFELGERIKELNCHNGMTQLFLNKNLSMDEVMAELVLLIPVAWQFPELAEAVVKVRNKTYKTKGYKKSEFSQLKEIIVSNEVIGYIEVCYPVRKLPPAEHIFLKEESDLLSSIAEITGDYIEIAEKSVALIESEKRFRNIVENINEIIYEYDEKGIIRYISHVTEKIRGYFSLARLPERNISIYGIPSEPERNGTGHLTIREKQGNFIGSRQQLPLYWMKEVRLTIMSQSKKILQNGNLPRRNYASIRL